MDNRVGILIDSTCDLPPDFVKASALELLPFRVKVGDHEFMDSRDPILARRFFTDQSKELDTESSPLSVEEIERRFIEDLVLRYDRLFAITISRHRSRLHQQLLQASFNILSKYRDTRQAAGIQGPFAVRVIDSNSGFSGEGVLVYQAVMVAARQHSSFDLLRSELESFSNHIHSYLIPTDLYYLRERARKKGEQSIGWLSQALSTALNIKPVLCHHQGKTEIVAKPQGFDNALRALVEIAINDMRAGLLSPVIVVSYGGSLEAIRATHSFSMLVAETNRHHIELLLSCMSITAGVNVGPGALSLAYAKG